MADDDEIMDGVDDDEVEVEEEFEVDPRTSIPRSSTRSWRTTSLTRTSLSLPTTISPMTRTTTRRTPAVPCVAASPRPRTRTRTRTSSPPDDVEADLDTILKDRLVSAEEANEDEEDEEPDDRAESGDRLQPKRADEQLCPSCFLLVRQGAPVCPVGDDDCPIFS